MEVVDPGTIQSAINGHKPGKRGWIRCNCPYCETKIGKVDTKRTLAVHVKGYVHCFRCGVEGQVSLDTGYDPADYEKPTDDEPVPLAPPEGYYPLYQEPALSAPTYNKFRNYVEKTRKLNPDVMKETGVGACMWGKYSGRIIVPVFGMSGSWMWFVSRDLAKKGSFKFPSGQKRGVMFNHQALLKKTDEPALLVESAFDALSVWPDGVAVLGKPTDQHLEALLSARRPVCVVLDGDAWEEGAGFAMKLKAYGQRAGSLKLGPKEDPDELNAQDLKERAYVSVM